jgi:hypothetical protein
MPKSTDGELESGSIKETEDEETPTFEGQIIFKGNFESSPEN